MKMWFEATLKDERKPHWRHNFTGNQPVYFRGYFEGSAPVWFAGSAQCLTHCQKQFFDLRYELQWTLLPAVQTAGWKLQFWKWSFRMKGQTYWNKKKLRSPFFSSSRESEEVFSLIKACVSLSLSVSTEAVFTLDVTSTVLCWPTRQR